MFNWIWLNCQCFFLSRTMESLWSPKGGWILMPSLTLFSGSTGWWVVMFKLRYLKETVLGSVYCWVDLRTIGSDAFLVQLHTGYFLWRVTMWYVWQTSSQIRNEIYLRNISMLLSTNRSTSWFLHISAKIKAPSTFINVSIVILLLFCKIK